MSLSSPIFIFGFLPICYLLYCVVPARGKNWFLLLVSVFFYIWNEPQFALYMIIMWVGVFIIGKFSFKSEVPWKKRILTLAIVVLLGILFIYKYMDFFILNINRVLGKEVVKAPAVGGLPLGLSFIIFTYMSYLFDIYYGYVQKQPGFIDSGIYFFHFAKISMGPIVRYSVISKRVYEKIIRVDIAKLATGIQRFAIGLAKKMILSNTVALVADRYWGITDFSNLSVAGAWLASVCYSLQIYFDFSGYSDMAIGVAGMFGFDFKENFNYPYTAKSIGDFWRRWHISLSQWFRDYVYIPLGGSRVSSGKHIRNLLIVWILTGIWHGANWNYVAWGLFYFLLQVFEKKTGLPQRLKTLWAKGSYRMFTLLCVNFGWVLFRAPGLQHAGHFILCMFGLQHNALGDLKTLIIFQDNFIILILAFLFSMPILSWVEEKLENSYVKVFYAIIKNIAVLIVFIVAVSYTVNSTYNPFIYLDF